MRPFSLSERLPAAPRYQERDLGTVLCGLSPRDPLTWGQSMKDSPLNTCEDPLCLSTSSEPVPVTQI